MLPRHHLPQLIPNRIQSALVRLEDAIWHDVRPLAVEATETSGTLLSCAEAQKLPLHPVEPCSFWGRLFHQRWYRAELPSSGAARWLNWRSQSEDTVYVDGIPYSGLDVAHKFCRLPDGASEVWIESNCIQSAIWHPEAAPMDARGAYFEGAFLCQRNEDAWQAYFDLKCLMDLAIDRRTRENRHVSTTLLPFGQQPVIDRYTPVFRRMLRIMDEAVDALDVHGTAALREVLAEGYGELRSEKSFMRCVLTGHAHIDLVWLWPERLGELKAVHTFSTVNRLMEDYPEFRFAYSQPASYAAVARRAPALYDKVLERMRSGQWQATGAMYVESDTLLACGEALSRSFLLGQRGFVAIAGRPSTLAWLPDAFGYSACLPQIMAQTGVKYFYTTKMTWNTINPFPHSSFIWKSNGHEVMAHITRDVGYNTFAQVNEIKLCVNAHQQGDIHSECLLPTGYGDGGGGPTAEICERARRLGQLPGMPDLAWDQPEQFFERMEPLRRSLPVHQGECYLEYHRGTYTTHGRIKSAFRGLEKVLQISEALTCALGRDWDRTHPWQRLVFAQFHDYIPGSSVWDVYAEGGPELEALADAENVKISQALQSPEGSPCLFNPHAVEIPKWVTGPDGPRRILLPPLAGTSIAKAKSLEVPPIVSLSGQTASNGRTSFRITDEGLLEDLVLDGYSVPLSGPLGGLVLYPDHASNFEAWDIDRHVLALGEPCLEPATITRVEEEAFRAGFSVERKIGRQSSATVTFLLEAGCPLVHITVSMDWREPLSLLKIIFPTRFAAPHARFGSPFGSVQRPQTSTGLVAEAMWEVPFSRHLAVFDEGEEAGLFVVTESKYGASVRDGVVGLSLVRSPRVTGRDAAHRGVWPRHLSDLGELPEFSDLHAHVIPLALGFYRRGLERAETPASLAETLFTKPVPYSGREFSSPLKSITGGNSLVPCWAKPLDPSTWILRLHEVLGYRGTVRIAAEPGWSLEKTDLGEMPHEPLADGILAFSPQEVLSVLFRRN